MGKRLDEGKNRSKQAVLAFCAAFIATSLLSGFGFLQERTIPQLLKQRADIMQMVWYSEVTPQEGEAMLKEIETHPLLSDDVEWLRAAEAGMDFAYVLDMEVLELKQTSRSLAGTCYLAEIQWELEEYNQHVTERRTYRIRTVRENDGTIRLSEFEVCDL